MQSVSRRPEYDQAAQKWDMERLFDDLLTVKQRMKPRAKTLSAFEMDYLCLLLAGYKPQDIANKINWQIAGLRAELSKGLYQYITELADRAIEDWRDVIIALEEAGYKRRKPQRMMVIIIDDTDAMETENIVSRLNQLVGDRSFKVLKTEIGSLILHLEGSDDAYNRIETLFNQGQLSEQLGYSVRKIYYTDVSAYDKLENPVCEEVVKPLGTTTPASPTPEHLSRWLQNVFDAGWQTMQDLFAAPIMAPAYATRNLPVFPSSDPNPRERHTEITTLIDHIYSADSTALKEAAARRLGVIGRDSVEAIAALIHLIRVSQDDHLRWVAADSLGMIDPDNVAVGVRRVKDLSMLLTSHALALMVAVMEKGSTGIAIMVRIYPLRGQRFLPDDVVLTVIDETGETFLEARSRRIDDYLQLHFSGQLGEPFSVRVSLGDVGITQNFVI
ncbi:MAG: DUF1822 family protein [Cyanobacteria bacterium]|nr:DUF1822 family protein [Cyanobacteriota bacterium]MDW8201950.1 DUF1822 family protein [Cyanobacteriota bacterium SKYGB_h_bin112]